MSQYLQSTDLFEVINDSKKYMRPLFEPLEEYERLARNRPHPRIDKQYPRVTDGTTASIIAKTPRRIFQQLPTGKALSDKNDWLTHVAGFLLTDQIIPHANAQYSFLQKCQAALGKAITYGSQPAYISFVNNGDYFGTDMTLPYIKDVFLEQGKLSDQDSNFIIMRSWYQPRDIEAIINRVSKLSNPEDSGWNLKVLAEIKDSITQKDDLGTTPNEKDKNTRSGGVEIYHVFQKGVEAEFFSFHLKTQQVVRTKKNKDPRGIIPIHYLYADIDMSNPLGRGFPELAGSMQNLIDAEVQMYQFNRALMLAPPTIKRGNWNKTQAKLVPNAMIDLGSDPNATWEALKLDTSALNNFPANFGLMKSQLLNLLSSNDTSVSSEVGNPGFSKTDSGVKAREEVLNVDDNFLRMQAEAWLERVFETQINLWFAEKSGVEDLQLDSDTATDIREIEPDMVSEDNKVRINYDTDTEKLKFRIDPGTSEQKDDQDEIAQLKEIIADVNANPYSVQYIQQAGKELQLGEVYKQLFDKLGLQNIDKILTDVPKDENGKPQATPPMAIDKPKLVINYDDVSSPTVKAALLNNAGIQADPQDIAQSDQAKAQMENPPKESAPQDHPIIKLMSSLNIKFTDLPEDSKQEVLQIIGIPSQMASPVQQDMTLKATAQQHDVLNGMQPQQADPNAPEAPGESESPQEDTTDTQPEQPQTQPSDNLTPEDHAYMEELQKHGLTPEQAGQALAMIHHGYSVEQVLQLLGGQ